MNEPTQKLRQSEQVSSEEEPEQSSDASLSETDLTRTRLLEAAHSDSETPDPFASITLADIAARIGKPESSILYQVEPRADTDALTVFRQLAYVRVVERFDTGIGRPTHEATIAALSAGKSIPQILAILCKAVALQFRLDPSTPYLLGSRTRMESNPDLAAAVDQAWTKFTSNLVDLIELTLAANRQKADIVRSDLVDLARTAVAAGWMQTELVVHIDHALVDIDGASFEQTGLVLWTGIKDQLAGISAT